jgi:hypothetical protein
VPSDSRSAVGPLSLSADLLALGGVIAPPEAQWGDPELPQAVLCPRLRTTYSPRVSWRGFAPAPEDSEKGPTEREWARLWEPAEPGDLGSSLAPNPKRPPRYGLAGLPSAGRRQVWRSLALLEDMRPLLSFWTVTLPPEALAPLAAADAVATFQDRLRKELERQLRLAGLVPLVVGVVEIQTKRAGREGRPVPHWHVVFQGRRSRSEPWALARPVLDGVIAAALGSAGVFGCDLRAAGNVQQVRKSVRAYLSKYMTKGSGDTAPWVGGPWEALLPRQWWFWTRALRSWVLEHVLPMAFEFLSWVHSHREAIDAKGLARFRLLPLSDPRAPATWEVNWLSCEHVAQLVYLWQLDSWDAQWERESRLNQWQHSPSRQSQAISTPMSAF